MTAFARLQFRRCAIAIVLLAAPVAAIAQTQPAPPAPAAQPPAPAAQKAPPPAVKTSPPPANAASPPAAAPVAQPQSAPASQPQAGTAVPAQKPGEAGSAAPADNAGGPDRAIERAKAKVQELEARTDLAPAIREQALATGDTLSQAGQAVTTAQSDFAQAWNDMVSELQCPAPTSTS